MKSCNKPDQYKTEKVIDEIMAHIRDLINDRHYGYLQINFFDGGVTTLNKHESIKLGVK